jgi:hypothetical protein
MAAPYNSSLFSLTALYREVATPDEIVGEGNFFPKMADNADALIDYALTFIPKSKPFHRILHLFLNSYLFYVTALLQLELQFKR